MLPQNTELCITRAILVAANTKIKFNFRRAWVEPTAYDPENLLLGLQVSRTLGDDPKQNDLELTKIRVPNPVLLPEYIKYITMNKMHIIHI